MCESSVPLHCAPVFLSVEELCRVAVSAVREVRLRAFVSVCVLHSEATLKLELV